MRTNNLFLKLVILLALIGIGVSGKLLSIHINFTTGQAGLTESCSLLPTTDGTGAAVQGCASVAVSDFSDVFGIPLAGIAMGFYFAILFLSFWALWNYQTAYEFLYVSFFLSTLSIVVTFTMFVISRFVLHSFCVWCSMLWIVNLLIWPALVKHLNLTWGNALAANLELFRHKNLHLKKERILNSFITATITVLICSTVAFAAEKMQKPPVPEGATDLVTEFSQATQVFLPAESAGGAQSKGLTASGTTPKMEIVEFADFQCPACRMAAQYMRPFALKFKDQIRITFRNFPLDGSCNSFAGNGPHNMACTMARAGICAGKQDKFWVLHDLFFDNQNELSPSLINELIAKSGVNEEAFEACLKDPATETQLQKEMQWGDMIQLSATPTLVINGRKLTGPKSPSELEALLKSFEKK